jgi:hypothetical protein
MVYSTIELKVKKSDGIAPEIMFSVASERVAGTELLRFDLPNDEDETIERRLMTQAQRTLKEMKGRGAIQLYATRDSFEALTTEAQYLINKYPELFEDADYESMSARAFYVKL